MATATKAKATTKRKAFDGPSPEQKLTESLIAVIESGVNPWQRPWEGGASNIAHTNICSGHAYSGGNPALLHFQMNMRGSGTPLWAGFAQAKAKGWFPKKGSKGCYAIRPQLNSREVQGEDGKPVLNEAGDATLASWVSYKPVCLFNVLDLEGEGLNDAIDKMLGNVVTRPEFERIADAERVLTAWHDSTECKLNHGGDRAFYSPTLDKIQLPNREKFLTAEGFYATWSHEIIHSTGHTLRLKRDHSGTFGSMEYAREELIAELGAFLLTNRMQVSSVVENHASYLSNWASILKEGPKVLFKVLSEATKAANLVLPDSNTPAA